MRPKNIIKLFLIPSQPQQRFDRIISFRSDASKSLKWKMCFIVCSSNRNGKLRDHDDVMKGADYVLGWLFWKDSSHVHTCVSNAMSCCKSPSEKPRRLTAAQIQQNIKIIQTFIPQTADWEGKATVHCDHCSYIPASQVIVWSELSHHDWTPFSRDSGSSTVPGKLFFHIQCAPSWNMMSSSQT